MTALGADKGDALYQWATVTMPSWGREGWGRAQSLSKSYLDLEKSTGGEPHERTR